MSQVSLGEYREEAASLVASGHYAAARQIVEHILGHYPDYIQGHELLAQSLLGTGNFLDAAAQFSWVLSCDPENAVARLGLARVHRALGNTRLAQMHLARAFDLFPGDPELRHEMNDLLASDTLLAVKQHEMSRAALARIYARNGLCEKAILEFDAVLQQEPDRYDVLVSLAETLWRDGHPAEAVTICHRVLEALPKALKANLIVGAAWLTSPQPEEAQPYLALAQALDPEHTQADLLFGPHSLFPRLTPTIERLAEPTIPALSALVDRLPHKPRLAVDRPTDFDGEETTSMSDQPRPEENFEIPDWLQGVGDELLAEDGVTTQPPDVSASADDTPDWLRALVSRVNEVTSEDVEVGAVASVGVGDVAEESEPADLPEWLRHIAAGESSAAAEPSVAATEPAAADAETADWLSQLSAMRTEAAAAVDDRASADQPAVARVADFEMPDVDVDETDLPDWLREAPAVAPTGETAAPPAELPDWLREEEQPQRYEPPTPLPADLPDWLKAIATGTPVADATAGSPTAEAATVSSVSPEAGAADELPDWLKEAGDSVAAGAPVATSEPSAAELTDELPDWLRPLAVAEATVQEQPEPGQPELAAWLTEDIAPAEPAVSAGEQMGQEPTELEAAVPDWLRELQEPRTQPAPATRMDVEYETAAPAVADTDLPEWLQRLRAGVADDAPPLGTRELEADLAALSIVGGEGGEPAEDHAPPLAGMPEMVEMTEALFEPPPAPPVAYEPAPAIEVPAPSLIEPSLPTAEEPDLVTESIGEQPVPAFPIEETPTVETVAAAAEVAIETAPPPVEEAVTATQPVPAPEVKVTVPPLEDLPRDAAERLALARAAAVNSWAQALSVYESLVSSADLLSTVIADLEEGIRKHPDDYAGYQLVGDAYMKDGRLPEALRAYRTALKKLCRQ